MSEIHRKFWKANKLIAAKLQKKVISIQTWQMEPMKWKSIHCMGCTRKQFSLLYQQYSQSLKIINIILVEAISSKKIK